MTEILADNDVQGQVALLMQILQGDPWREFSDHLTLTLRTFEDLRLSRDATDATLWRACQQRGVVLITGNRNSEGPDSLEATINGENSPDYLPVFTLAKPARILKDHGYAQRAAEKLLEYLLDIELFRGVGRFYLP